eukprot:716761-Hanusia_phi.AAC.3
MKLARLPLSLISSAVLPLTLTTSLFKLVHFLANMSRAHMRQLLLELSNIFASVRESHRSLGSHEQSNQESAMAGIQSSGAAPSTPSTFRCFVGYKVSLARFVVSLSVPLSPLAWPGLAWPGLPFSVLSCPPS